MPANRPQFDLVQQQRRLRQGLALLWLGVQQTGTAGMWLALIWLRRAGGLVFALIVLFEQWGWKPLVAALSVLARLAPIAAIERWIASLPPYGALVAFALPTALLLPLKLLALFLIANGHTVMAAALFIGAKIVGTAIVARLYLLTEDKLMQIGWFRQAYGIIMPRLQALHEEIRRSWAWRYGRMLKTKAKHAVAPMVARLKVRLAAVLWPDRGSA